MSGFSIEHAPSLGARLSEISAIAITDGNFIVGDGSGWVAESGATARTSLGLGTAAVKNTGTSGDAVPLANGANTWGAAQTFSSSMSHITTFPVMVQRQTAAGAVDQFIGGFQFQGLDSAANVTTYADLLGQVTIATDGAERARYVFRTTNNGSATSRLVVAEGLYHASATGGDKGNNTINFGAVYDDNTLLTCYVFDAALDGKIEDAKWDAKVPDRPIPEERNEAGKLLKPATTEERLHGDMRKFRARLGTETDPLDLDKYINHWKTKRHLTSLPNEANFDTERGMPTGDWIQRLVETVEIQAVHIAQLNDRLKVLEANAIL